MRVIITGGTGSTGVTLANTLDFAGHDVVILSRNPRNAPLTLNSHIKVLQWDARTGDGWSHLIDNNTALINLAGKNPANWRWTDAHKQQVLESRLNAAKAVISACEQGSHKPSVLLQASAVGYYGDTGQEEVREDACAGDTWRAQVCVRWENALQPIEIMGIRTVYLRIGIVLDRNGGALPPFVLAGQLMGRQLGDGKQWIPWIHNDDVSGAIQFLMENESLQGVFNICSPYPVQNREFLNTITRILSRPSFFPVPAIALRLAMGEMANTILDSQRIIPQKLLDSGYDFLYPQLELALQDML